MIRACSERDIQICSLFFRYKPFCVGLLSASDFIFNRSREWPSVSIVSRHVMDGSLYKKPFSRLSAQVGRIDNMSLNE